MGYSRPDHLPPHQVAQAEQPRIAIEPCHEIDQEESRPFQAGHHREKIPGVRAPQERGRRKIERHLAGPAPEVSSLIGAPGTVDPARKLSHQGPASPSARSNRPVAASGWSKSSGASAKLRAPIFS